MLLRLIMTHDLDKGSQIPYIKRAMDEGFEVVVLNTNLNKFPDNSRGSGIKPENVPVTSTTPAVFIFIRWYK